MIYCNRHFSSTLMKHSVHSIQSHLKQMIKFSPRMKRQSALTNCHRRTTLSHLSPKANSGPFWHQTLNEPITVTLCWGEHPQLWHKLSSAHLLTRWLANLTSRRSLLTLWVFITFSFAYKPFIFCRIADFSRVTFAEKWTHQASALSLTSTDVTTVYSLNHN